MTGKAEIVTIKRARLTAERLRMADGSPLRTPAAAALKTPPYACDKGVEEGMALLPCQAGWYREAIRFVPADGAERFLFYTILRLKCIVTLCEAKKGFGNEIPKQVWAAAQRFHCVNREQTDLRLVLSLIL